LPERSAFGGAAGRSLLTGAKYIGTAGRDIFGADGARVRQCQREIVVNGSSTELLDNREVRKAYLGEYAGLLRS
jgi:hypothetical protein